MSYITWAELVARYKKIASDYDESEAVQGFIAGAEAEIDSRLGVRYTVPFSLPAPPIIKDLAIDMAFYRMYWRQEGEGPLKDFIERRLGALASGSATIVASGQVFATDVQAWSERDGIRSVFGPDDAPNYSVSQDWQNTAQREREND